MRYISLFSGIGGLDRAIDSLGNAPLIQVERDPYCRSILDLRWPHVRKHDDVTTFSIRLSAYGRVFGSPIDLVVGGPPCQPVSHAGRRKGTDDERWLWGEALRVVREAQPRRVFFENPMGLRTLGLDAILAELSDMGYGGAWEVVAAADVGAPHLRKRIFIMGERGRTGWDGPTRPPGNSKVMWPSPNASGERPNEGNVRLLRARVLAGDMTEAEAAGMLNGKSVFAAPGKVPAMPTPTARLGGQRGPQAKRYFDPARSNDLDDYVAAFPEAANPLNAHQPFVEKFWPTPSAGDNRDRGHSEMPAIIRRREKGKQLNLSMTVSTERGALSPDWTEWLVGLPIGWSDVTKSNDDLGPVYSWDAEPNIPRVGLGFANRGKRLTAIGNIVVPAQAVFAYRRLAERLGITEREIETA